MAQNGQEFFSMYSAALVYGKLFEWIPGAFSLQKWCRIMFPGVKVSGFGGLPVGIDSSLTPEGNSGRLVLFTTPEAALRVEDDAALLYLHLLFALKDENLGVLYADHGAVLLRMLEMLEDPRARRQLLADVETGSIGPHLDLPLPTRVKLEAGAKPDRRRAAQVRAALAAHDTRGSVAGHFLASRRRHGGAGARSDGPPPVSAGGALVSDLWPRMHCVVGAMSGPYSTLKTSLRRRFLPDAARLPVFDPMFLSTEALVGGNIAPFDDAVPPPPARMDLFEKSLGASEDGTESGSASGLLPGEALGHRVPRDTAFLLLPQSAFFEFVPERSIDEAQPATKLLHELRLGERVEVVVTTKAGLWRYRTGDVVRVVGLEQGALPLVELLYRDSDTARVPTGAGAGEQRVGGVTSDQVLRALRECESKWFESPVCAAEAGSSTAAGGWLPWIAWQAAQDAEKGDPEGSLTRIEEFCVIGMPAAEGGGASDLATNNAMEVVVELAGGSTRLSAAQQAEFDHCLARHSPAYRGARQAGLMQAATLRPTALGAFSKRMDRAIAPVEGEPLTATPAALYKPPRLDQSAESFDRV